MIQFTVYGDPAPKGSARAFVPKGWTRPVITSATKGLKDWERKIAAVASLQSNGILFTGPLELNISFHLSRPKSLPTKTVDHTKRPDLDKLIRGATDALTGVIWKDDAQLVVITAAKYYAATTEEAPRAVFAISTLEER